ncbi:restriction endonuclease [Streptomyces sp. NBC_00390]|uniref:restriction endonuclease n=1 Tax=Streptomyces sp. NBC_00390 TaxID=2975736 RepID=UPI002E1E215C
MARKKSLAAQLVQAYRDAQKAKAAEARRQEREQAQAERAAAQKRQQRERQAAQQERERQREQARDWERAQKEAERQRAEQARKAEQVVRELEKREAARAREAEQKKKAAARQSVEAARLVKQQASEELRQEASRRTAEVEEQVLRLQSVLASRTTALQSRRPGVEKAVLNRGSDGLTAAVDAALAAVPYPDGLGGVRRSAYAPETRELLLEVDLPGQSVVPTAVAYRYKASPPTVVPQPRKEAEVKQMYRTLVARLALRAIDEALAVTPPALVDVVAFNGHVNAKDRATGKSIRPCLVSVRASREAIEELVLDEPELDPVECLRRLNAVVSQHPYDLEPVRPVVTFDLSKYKWAPDELDVVAGLDHRPDLVALDPIEFEHLIRRLFEAIGLKAWVTQASRDDGVDAVAVNEDPIVGGLCIIQAKRTKNTVPADSVRALAGVMHDKAAAKGIVVTTAWFGKASHDFAQRTGRMELIDGRGLKALLLEHLGIDALIGLPKLPPGWQTQDLR